MQTNIEEIKKNCTYLSKELLITFIKPLKFDQHKYEAGSIAVFAGSLEMAGAAKLVCKSIIHSGAGHCVLIVDETTKPMLFGLSDEVPVVFYSLEDHQSEKNLHNLSALIQSKKAVAIGPGLGLCEKKQTFFEQLISTISIKTVLDADALTYWAKRPYIFPKETVLTPHMGELKRLLEREYGQLALETLDQAFLEMVQNFCNKYHVTMIVKGVPTFIISCDSLEGKEKVGMERISRMTETEQFYSRDGDPGMASAGTGDVLCGLVGSFLAQDYTPLEASLIAVYVHSNAGSLQANKYSSYYLTASVLIEGFPNILKQLS